MHTYLEFESQVAELEGKIAELRALAVDDPGMSIDEEVGQLERKAAKSLADLYATLTPWQKTQVARHALRPHFLDYQRQLFRDFVPLGGDRSFGDDQAIVGGPAWFGETGCSSVRRRAMTLEAQAQFRHGASRGLPQGGEAHGACRALRSAGAHLRRYRRGLSRHRCRGARPGRSDRALDRSLPGAWRADHLGGDRRRRVRWPSPPRTMC